MTVRRHVTAVCTVACSMDHSIHAGFGAFKLPSVAASRSYLLDVGQYYAWTMVVFHGIDCC